MMADKKTKTRQEGDCTSHVIHGHSVELVACVSDALFSGGYVVAVVDGTMLRGEYAPISWADEERALKRLAVILMPKATGE
jgi:hypothetical protein